MEFRFPYKVKPVNLWTLTMVNIYRAMPGLVNIIFTASMVLLAIRFWFKVGLIIKLLIIAAISIFPLLQPLLIFFRCRKTVKQMPQNMEISFDKSGITTTANEKSSHIDFSEVKVLKIFRMIILYTQDRSGFILDNELLKNQREDFSRFLNATIKNKY